MTTTLASERKDYYPTRVASPREPVVREHPAVWGSEAGGPFSAAELQEHEARGFTIMKDFISSDDVNGYLSELARIENDPQLQGDARVVTEKTTGTVRSVFDVHHLSEALAGLSRDPKLLERARQIVGTDVYLHQTRINYQPGFEGSGFYWHSDFETWHAEDGMSIPRSISCQIALTDNFPYNGGLMVMPGSHKSFLPCVGETPENNYKSSLKAQKVGVPREEDITLLSAQYGIEQFTGPAGTALWFDSNIMHGSGNNITPYPRSNIFMVFNSVENTLVEPFTTTSQRPEYIAHRDFTPLV